MNYIALLTFLAGILYLGLGYYGLKLDWRARLHQIFFLLCLACSWWAFCIAFMFIAPDRETAWLLFRLSSPGWSLGPALTLHFTIILTTSKPDWKIKWLTLFLYIPGLIFTYLGMTVGVTARDLILRDFGWDNITANDFTFWLYVFYYLLYVGISIAIIIYWGYRTKSKRKKSQAKILAIFSLTGLVLAGGSETLIPLLGFGPLPKLPAVMWLFWAFGMWYAIVKYRLLIMSPYIAAEKIFESIADMLIMIKPFGHIISVNQSTQNLLGYNEPELNGHHVELILEEPSILQDTLEKINNGMISTAKMESGYKSKSGDIIPVMLSCSAIRDNFSDLVGILIVAQDLRATKQLKLQNLELEAIGADLLATNLMLEKKSSQVKAILDNVGQGFFSFGQDLVIDDEYSRECINIIGKSPAGFTLAELLYPYDYDERELLNEVLAKIMNKVEDEQINLYKSLLPNETELDGRTIQLEYKIVNTNLNMKLITIMSDITEKRRMEKEMEEEKNTMGMVVKAIVFYEQWTECIREYDYFTKYKLYQIIEDNRPIDSKIEEINRYLHTFKGNFSQFNSNLAVKRLHDMESQLNQIKKYSGNIDENMIRSLLLRSNLSDWLKEDLERVSSILGEDYWSQQNGIRIDKKYLIELEKRMINFLPYNANAQLLPLLKKMQHKSLKEMLRIYPELTYNLADRMGKLINPFTIEGDDVMLDSDYYGQFIRSLIHVFRNIVDHGIEYPDERINLGKREAGNIYVQIESNDELFKITISDDGAGFDEDKLIANAFEKGKFNADQIQTLSKEQILELAFETDISTADEISVVSGRGIGLSTVKYEVEKINGRIQINNYRGDGSSLTFFIPIITYPELPTIIIDDLLCNIVATMQERVLRSLGIDFGNMCIVETVNSLRLEEYSTIINIRGLLDGFVLMSFSENLVKNMAQIFHDYEYTSEMDHEILEDVAAETSNIILGNSLKSLESLQDLFILGIPAVLYESTTIVRQAGAPIYNCSLNSNDHKVLISFIPL